ncbi:MAG: hypothetical protein P8P74_10665 [Crocinitomicaceae bacterium]|nr:hypothetical protein [Crocinitomicaceae bacterium]
MKKLLALCAILVCTFPILGQTDGVSMIKSVYGENHYNEMVSTNPGQIELLEKYAVYGFHVVDAEDKYDVFPELTEVPLRSKSNNSITIQAFLQAYNSGNFNPLNYSFFPGKEIQVFRLQGTDFVILIDNQSNILVQ